MRNVRAPGSVDILEDGDWRTWQVEIDCRPGNGFWEIIRSSVGDIEYKRLAYRM
jgi:hypothetical protein